MIPVLVMYTGFVAMMGSFLDIHANELTSYTAFVQSAFQKITFLDYTSSIIRAIVYGFTIGMVGCYNGYHTSQGTEGVGRAANRSVVISMFFIFVEEIIIVQIVNALR
jgi:phospholipid/cholesterol/gamma-HCH transport system permease protein